MKSRKFESSFNFGNFHTYNSRYRNRSGTTEVCEIFHNGELMSFGTYRRINRPWQCYDYEIALSNAFDSLMDSISWKFYEENKSDLELIKQKLERNF